MADTGCCFLPLQIPASVLADEYLSTFVLNFINIFSISSGCGQTEYKFPTCIKPCSLAAIFLTMLSKEKFSKSDLEVIKKIPKSFLVYLIPFICYCIPASLLLGLLGLLPKGNGYWPITLGLLGVFSFTLLWLTIKEYISYKRDMANQIKYCGTITVTKKSPKKGDTAVYISSNELQKIDLHSKDIFDAININDQLYLEISKYSRQILVLKKDMKNLLNAS